MAAKKRKNYSREFKVETVKLITEGGESVGGGGDAGKLCKL